MGQAAGLSSDQGQVVEGSPTPGSVGNASHDVDRSGLDRKPLVPITPMVSATDSATGPVVRRLPPVESTPATISAVGRDTTALSDPTPLYPSTGLQ
ncbi:MAG: hypothetical protein LLF97_07800 [Planctomycetaceae bacterium]|nr:hypothetical protein [Planctomycetaceae bacterium]